MLIELSYDELVTLYYDAGATADGPWPPEPTEAINDIARQGYKDKITNAYISLRRHGTRDNERPTQTT